MKTFYVEYEIPPLRAIYHQYFEAKSDKEILKGIHPEHPTWRILKVQNCCGACQCRIIDGQCGCNPHYA